MNDKILVTIISNSCYSEDSNVVYYCVQLDFLDKQSDRPFDLDIIYDCFHTRTIKGVFDHDYTSIRFITNEMAPNSVTIDTLYESLSLENIFRILLLKGNMQKTSCIEDNFRIVSYISKSYFCKLIKRYRSTALIGLINKFVEYE